MKDCKDDGAKLVVVTNPSTEIDPPLSQVRDLPKKKDTSIAPGQDNYEKSCAVCHATDKMGAPAVGDKETWSKVMEKGMDKVLENAIKGTGLSLGKV